MVFPPFASYRRYAFGFFVGLFPEYSNREPQHIEGAVSLSTAFRLRRRHGMLFPAPALWPPTLHRSGAFGSSAHVPRPGRLGAQADGNSLHPSSGRDPSSTDSARMAAAASGRATAIFASVHRRLFPSSVLRSFPPGMCFAASVRLVCRTDKNDAETLARLLRRSPACGPCA